MAYDDDYDVDSEDLGEYVPVTYARTPDEAERYRQLLEDHDVPAVVDEDYEPGASPAWKSTGAGVPVLVPESLLEDAREFLAEIEEMAALPDEEDEVYDDEEDDDLTGEAGYGRKTAVSGEDDLEDDLEEDEEGC